MPLKYMKYMKVFAILIPVLFILSSLYGVSQYTRNNQENLQGGWLKIYDSSIYPSSLIKTEDGYVMAGWDGVIKVDESGNVIWKKEWGSWEDIIEVEDGYVLAGWGVGKISKDGKILWKKYYKYRDAESIVEARDGYIVVGQDFRGDKFWIMKIDENGNEIWNITDGEGCGEEIIRGIDGGYIVAGFTASYGAGGYDAFFLKIDDNGSIIWKKTWGGVYMDEARCITATEDGYVATGYYNDFNFLILKLDKNGNVLWYKRARSCDTGEGITVCPDGYAAVGFCGDACLIRFDKEGNEIWHRYFGGGDPNDFATSVLYDNGYFILCGGYGENIIAGHPGPFLIKCPDSKPENVSIEIIRPKPKYLYIFDREIMPYKKTLIIGSVTVVAELHGNGKRVEFYLSGGPDYIQGYLPVKVLYSPPYEWKWGFTGDTRLKSFSREYVISVRTYFGDEEATTSDILFPVYKWL